MKYFAQNPHQSSKQCKQYDPNMNPNIWPRIWPEYDPTSYDPELNLSYIRLFIRYADNNKIAQKSVTFPLKHEPYIEICFMNHNYYIHMFPLRVGNWKFIYDVNISTNNFLCHLDGFNYNGNGFEDFNKHMDKENTYCQSRRRLPQEYYVDEGTANIKWKYCSKVQLSGIATLWLRGYFCQTKPNIRPCMWKYRHNC